MEYLDIISLIFNYMAMIFYCQSQVHATYSENNLPLFNFLILVSTMSKNVGKNTRIVHPHKTYTSVSRHAWPKL
jgi:hypothetical protein